MTNTQRNLIPIKAVVSFDEDTTVVFRGMYKARLPEGILLAHAYEETQRVVAETMVLLKEHKCTVIKMNDDEISEYMSAIRTTQEENTTIQ